MQTVRNNENKNCRYYYYYYYYYWFLTNKTIYICEKLLQT